MIFFFKTPESTKTRIKYSSKPESQIFFYLTNSDNSFELLIVIKGNNCIKHSFVNVITYTQTWSIFGEGEGLDYFDDNREMIFLWYIFTSSISDYSLLLI